MIKPCSIFFGAALLTVLVMIGLTPVWADPACPVTQLEGRVELVDLSNQTNPKVVISLVRPVGALAVGSKVTAAVEVHRRSERLH